MKQAVLLVVFGSSEASAQPAFDAIERRVATRFPGVERRWAYTSGMIRRKLARTGRMVDSPAEALRHLQADGFDRVAVQSFHTIAGVEFHDLLMEVLPIRVAGSFARIEIGLPLLASAADLRRAVRETLASVPAERRAGDAVLLMGHGTEGHPSELAYVAAAYAFHGADPCAWLACVEGEPEIGEVLPQAKAVGCRRAWLVPFMAVAGNHVKHDMAGDDADSWASRVKAAGIEPVPVFKGTAELAGVLEIWMDHLQSAIARLDEEKA